MKIQKIAFSVLNNRIAPVFDTAGEMIVAEAEGKKIITEVSRSVSENNAYELIDSLVNLQINVLVCGAISRAFQTMIEGKGIKVVSFIAGDITDVKNGWMKDELGKEGFLMPGCCGLRNRNGARGMGRMNVNGRDGVQLGRGGRGCGFGLGQGVGQGKGLGRGQGFCSGKGLGRGAGYEPNNG